MANGKWSGFAGANGKMRGLPAIGYRLRRLQAGVTLVELLVVIAVIAVLASVIFFYINPVTQFQKGRDVRRKADLAQIQGALEFYRSDFGVYPATIPTCGQKFDDGGTPAITYIDKMPCEPIGTPSSSYFYTEVPSDCTTACTSYELYACLEIITDSLRDADDQVVLPAPGDKCTGVGRVSYTVKSL